MPIWLRRFTFNQIQDFYTKQSEKNKPNNKTTGNKPFRPDVNPTYSSKASKK